MNSRSVNNWSFPQHLYTFSVFLLLPITRNHSIYVSLSLQKKYYLWCQITQNALWINREKNTYHLHCLGVGYHIPFTVYFPIMAHSLCVSIIQMQHCMQQCTCTTNCRGLEQSKVKPSNMKPLQNTCTGTEMIPLHLPHNPPKWCQFEKDLWRKINCGILTF